MMERDFQVKDQAGVHARPASILVDTANQYQSELKIRYSGKSANLKSILGVMTLGIPYGEEFTIQAEGADEEEAIRKLEETLKNEGLIG